MIKKLILFLLISCGAYAQKISIDLSIEWEKRELSMQGMKFDSIPYLKIEYVNLSDENLYCMKIYRNSNCLPNFLSSVQTINFEDKLIHYNPFVCNWNVFVGGIVPDNLHWYVLPDSLNFSSEHEADLINDVLYEIYSPLSDPLTLSEVDNINRFDKLQDEDILNCMRRDDMVFLKSEETYSEYYSLIGFLKVKGNYTFLLSLDRMQGYVEIKPFWNSNTSKFEREKKKLPKRIECYSLYDGIIRSNRISVQFK